MGTQGASQHSFTFDAATLLHDGAAIVATGAGEVGAVARVLDFGNVDNNGVVQVAHMQMAAIVDVRAFDFAEGSETALLILQLSDDTSGNGVGFDAGDVVANKAVLLAYGDEGGIAGSTADDVSAVGRNVVTLVDNEFLGTPQRFARLFAVMGGVTPSIEPFVWLSRVL